LFVPYTFRESGTGQTSKALFITADEDVVVYGVNKELYSADAFLAFPTDVLGNEYYAGLFKRFRNNLALRSLGRNLCSYRISRDQTIRA